MAKNSKLVMKKVIHGVSLHDECLEAFGVISVNDFADPGDRISEEDN